MLERKLVNVVFLSRSKLMYQNTACHFSAFLSEKEPICRKYCVQTQPKCALNLLKAYPGLTNTVPKRHFSFSELTAMQSNIFTSISQSSTTSYFKDFVISVHDVSGLPWWAAVISSTFILRFFITLPLAIYQNYIFAKVENISMLEMPEIAKEIQKETTIKAKNLSWSKNKANIYYKRTLKKEWNTLIIRDNCHPFKGTATLWFQLPTWIFFSSALRNLAYMLPVRNAEAELLYMKLSVGGLLWIPNLTQSDGLLILPIILGLSNLAIIEIQAMMRLRESTRLQRYATNFFRGFSIILIPIAATVPSVLCLYWTTSSLLGLIQNLFLMSNKIRNACGISDTPSTLDHPYQQLGYEIRQKGRRFSNYFRKLPKS